MENVRKVISALGGRRFLLAVLTVGAVVLNQRFGLNISEDMLNNIVNVVMIFIAGESSVDVASAVINKLKK